MFQKMKSIVLSMLGIASFAVSDGKASFTDEQRKTIEDSFGADFVNKFVAALDKELAEGGAATDNSAELTAAIEKHNADKVTIEALNSALAKLEETVQAQKTLISAMAKKGEEDLSAQELEPLTIKGLKEVSFKPNMKAQHNNVAMKFLRGEPVPSAGDSINVDDLKSEFGTFISQNERPVLKALTQPTESEKYMTTKLAITEWRATQAIISSVVQQFVAKWTPLGAAEFTPLTIKNYRHKVNVPITPDEVNDSWLSFLYDEGLTPEQMPITKYIIQELVIPKIDDDRELKLIATGVYEEFQSAPATNDPGQATGKSMDGFITTIIKQYEDPNSKVNFLKLGAITDANIVDKMNQFVDSIAPLYRTKNMNLFTSDTRYRQYKRSYQELYPLSKNADKANDVIDYSSQVLTSLPSMAGVPHFFTTPKENFIRLRHKNEPGKINLQTADYDVKVFAEWWEGVGFAMAEALFAYVDALAVIQGYALKSDADKLQIYMLTDAGVTATNPAKLAGYKTAIAAESSIADLAALQTIVNTVNAA